MISSVIIGYFAINYYVITERVWQTYLFISRGMANNCMQKKCIFGFGELPNVFK